MIEEFIYDMKSAQIWKAETTAINREDKKSLLFQLTIEDLKNYILCEKFQGFYIFL